MESTLDRALAGTLAILAQVRPEHLDRPTPCASWDVRALVNHFVGSARWWAATISEDGGVTEADYAAGDVVAAYEQSIRSAATAFGADGALAKTIQLPFGEFPGAVLLNLATMEQFTHGWDLARAIGLPADLDPGLAAGLLRSARLAISDAFRGPDGQALFGPAREAPAGTGPAGQLAAFLGRVV
jgi:uncharacterized protein (TIGR03086 family)